MIKKLRPPIRKKQNWDYKDNNNDIQPNQLQNFQLYLLTKPEQLKKQFIEQVPYFWVHEMISKNRQFQVYLNELKNQIQVKGFPYVDNMLQQIDSLRNNYKIICQIKDLQRILEFHSQNPKLLSIYIFDKQLKNEFSSKHLKHKKIQIKSDEFKSFQRLLYRKIHDKNQTQLFMNSTRITNWDISQVNKSRLVLKTLLVSKNDQKGKDDFVKLATIVQRQIGQVYEYQNGYKIDSTASQAIKWYSKQSFYHRLINNTLKGGHGNPLLLSYIRFPVKQLYQSIKLRYNSQKLYQKQFECYRGGRISDFELQYFKNNKNGFIEMQGFLSCSKSKKEMQQFIVNCVFKIKINNLQRDTEWDHGYCLLDSEALTQFIKEQEVLFNIFSVMEIKDVTKEIYGTKVVDVITLQYGSLAAQLYKKKNGLELTSHQKRCINNYQALKPYYQQIESQGDCFKFFNQHKLAEQYYLKVIKHFQRLYHSNIIQSLARIQIFNAYLSLGPIYYSLNQIDKSKDYYQKAKKFIEQSTTQSHIDIDTIKIASIYNGLGLIYKNLQQKSQAKSCYLKSIGLLINKTSGRKYLTVAYNNLAGLYSDQKNDQQALKFYTKALDLIQNQNNQTVANVLYNIGIIYYQKDNYKSAIKNLVKSLQILNQIFGTHKQTALTHFKLGQVYLKQNSLYESDRHFQSSMQMTKQLYSAFDQKYIKLKREIQNLKLIHHRSINRSTSSVHINQKMTDVFGFMNNNDQVSKILKGLGQRDKTSSLDVRPSTLEMPKNQFNSPDKIRYFRGQNIVNGQSPTYTVKKQQALQQALTSKMANFDKQDFVKSLQTGQKKIIKLY